MFRLLFLLLFTTSFVACGNSKSNTVFDFLAVGNSTDFVTRSLEGKYYYIDSAYVDMKSSFGPRNKLTEYAPVYIGGHRGVLVVYSINDVVIRYDWFFDSVALWPRPIEVDSLHTYYHASATIFKSLQNDLTELLGSPTQEHLGGEPVTYWKSDSLTMRFDPARRSIVISKGGFTPLPRSSYTYRYRTYFSDASFASLRLGQVKQEYQARHKGHIDKEKVFHYIGQDDAEDSAFYSISVFDTLFGLPGRSDMLFNPQDQAVMVSWHTQYEPSESYFMHCLGQIESILGPPMDKIVEGRAGSKTRYWTNGNQLTYCSFYPEMEFVIGRMDEHFRHKRPSRREEFVPE